VTLTHLSRERFYATIGYRRAASTGNQELALAYWTALRHLDEEWSAAWREFLTLDEVARQEQVRLLLDEGARQDSECDERFGHRPRPTRGLAPRRRSARAST
jgi:hypothetical protein